MKAALDPLKRVELASETVSLRGGVPVVNGGPLEGWG